jgi:hypothetical protein
VPLRDISRKLLFISLTALALSSVKISDVADKRINAKGLLSHTNMCVNSITGNTRENWREDEACVIARDKVPLNILSLSRNSPRGASCTVQRREHIKRNHYQHLTSTAPNLHNLKPKHKMRSGKHNEEKLCLKP